ncbi:neurofilament heavy polypeptide isoform X3 [Drosophila willistoni]|uniref:neurofilament heavy polypeptide isoform X3 n=1 Tax=Drosophila willistoni TaxID=7260 RepID=UPI000C26C98C|nr:neurofilament heavy polypeptide isoform X3 [Drosophila willistoni]
MDSNSEVVTTVPEVEPAQSANTMEENKESQAPKTVETVTITTKENVEKDEDDAETKTTTTTTVKLAKKENGEETTTTTTTTTVSVEAPSPDDAVTVTAESQEVEVEPKTETKVETVTETSTTKAPEPEDSDAQVEKESNTVAEASVEPKDEDNVSVKEDTQVESEEIEEVEETESEAEEDDAEDEEEEAEEKSNILIDQPSKEPVEVKPENQESVSVTLKAPSTKTTDAEAKIPDSVDQADAPTDIKSLTIKRDFNDQIQDIISDIDVNIKAQEKISKLKEQELQLIQKQQELANQIRQQQILAQQLIAQNELKQQQLNAQQQSVSQAYEVKESTNVSKAVDLRKIFTPATDAPEILPKNRKLYASSAFYSPSLHPTVEDQVELARRISHSLSDISNQKSKGQSMFVNRKKRSVKWVHEGCAQDYQQYQPRPISSPNIVPAYSDAGKHRVQLNIHQDQLIEKYSKPGLQVVKSPWEAALQTGSASSAFQEETRYRSQTPIVSAASPSNYDREDFSYSGSNRPFLPPPSAPVQQEVPYNKPSVPTPVNPQRELAYKPSVAQGWGGRNVELPREYSEYFEPVSSGEEDSNVVRGDMRRSSDCARMDRWYNPSPDFTMDVQNRLHQLEQFQQYFLEQQKRELEILKLRDNMRLWRSQAHRKPKGLDTTIKATPKVINQEIRAEVVDKEQQVNVRELISSFEQQSLREYEESLQYVNRHSHPLQADRIVENHANMDADVEVEELLANSKTNEGLYVPKEISLASYVPPPNQYQAPGQSHYQPAHPGVGHTSNDGVSGCSSYGSRFAPANEGSASFGAGCSGAFPLSRPTSGFNTSSMTPAGVPRQQFNAPSSYQKIPQGSSQSAAPVNFNPSPLSFDKLSKFEQPDQYQGNSYGSPSPHPQQQRYLNARYGSNVRNTSPSPFGLGASSPVDPVLSSPISTPNLGQQQSLNKYAPYRPAPAQNQSFNNCARGWGSGLGSARQGAPVPRGTIASAGNLPYSDF